MVVHKNLLCETSRFFQTSCNGQWSESKEKTVRLKEVDPESFAIYVKWLYTGNLDVLHGDTACTAPFHPFCGHTDDRLIDGYLLGDFLGDQDYCNASTDKLLDLSIEYDCTPSLAFVMEYWSRLPVHSGLRRMLMDQQASHVREHELRELAATMPSKLLVELAVLLTTVRSTKADRSPEHRPKGHYHDMSKEPQAQILEARNEGA